MSLAYALGITLVFLGAVESAAIFAPLGFISLFLLLRRPWPAGVLLAATLAGIVAAIASDRSEHRDCRLHLPPMWEGTIEGRFLARPAPGPTFPFRLESGGPGGCHRILRASVPAGAPIPVAGERIRTTARWEGRGFPTPGRGEWAGRLRMSSDWEPSPGGGIVGAGLHLRGRIQQRMVDLWGDDGAPVVEALVLARREHLDPDLREAFARTGTTHLLAISGFHVGVIAGIFLGLLKLAGLRLRRAEMGAVACSWLYVLGIGAPHAAVRAALILTLFVAARWRGRPVVSTGALASALLVLLFLNPGWLASIGFQLSFAGTAGLILLREPVGRGVARGWQSLTGRPLPRGPSSGFGAGLLKGSAAGVTAGVSATLPTLPLLAWHFDRISLLGVPATLAIAPLVASAIPGIGVSLILSALPGGFGSFLAGGTGFLLDGVGRVLMWGSMLPGTSLWVSRSGLIAAMFGGVIVFVLLRHGFPGRVGPSVRGGAATAVGVSMLLLLPLLPVGQTLELHTIDVGQGDAIALRSPSGRWILIDSGPRGPGFDAGARRVVPYLRRQGVRRLDAIVQTHPHLDHIGGTGAVIRAMDVRGILDPSRPHGSRPYLEVLEEVQRRGVSWWRAEEGDAFRTDDVRIQVLGPDSETLESEHVGDPNDLSVVLLVRWGRASILLTGDAPEGVERRILSAVPPLTILKVGHHGSRTSTSVALLEATRPRVAVVPVGDGNTYGHPHPVVMERLEAAGVPAFRTDRDGSVRFRLRRDGTVDVRVSR